jgi:hypothetical protein
MRVTASLIRATSSKLSRIPTDCRVKQDQTTDHNGNHRRHLLRLWLRDPENAWETPPPLASRWDRVYEGVTPELQAFPLEPHTRSEGTPSTK